MSDIDNEDIREHKVKVLIQEPRAMAKQRLMDFAASLGGGVDYEDYRGDHNKSWEDRTDDDYGHYEEVTYDMLMERTRDYLEGGEYWSEGGRFEGQGLYDKFWEDYELVTNTVVDPNNKYSFFSCSC